MARFKGKTVIVTGGNSGVGEATAKLLAQEGANVVIAARRVGELDRVAGEISAQGGTVLAVPTDVREEAQANVLIARAIEAFGKVDALINCAGIMDKVTSLEHASDELFHDVVNTNTLGVFHCMRAVINHMVENKAGAIVNVASVAGKYGAGGAAYAASKGGCIALTKSTAMRYAPLGIRCNCICPGAIITPMIAPENMAGADMEMISALGTHQCQEVPPTYPEEQAKVLAFLISDDAVAINGQAITVDKGTSL